MTNPYSQPITWLMTISGLVIIGLVVVSFIQSNDFSQVVKKNISYTEHSANQDKIILNQQADIEELVELSQGYMTLIHTCQRAIQTDNQVYRELCLKASW